MPGKQLSLFGKLIRIQRNRLHRGNMNYERIKFGTLLGFEDFQNSLFIKRIGGKTVYRFRWYGNRFTQGQQTGGFTDIGSSNGMHIGK